MITPLLIGRPIDLLTKICESVIVKLSMSKSKKTDKEPTKLEECQPGATKAQVFEALRIIATTEVKPKPTSKKKS